MNFDEIRPCWLEINLDNLKHNIHIIQANVKPGSEIMAVVKANAYNHDAVTVVKELHLLGVRRFCVSILSEGLELRKAGIKDSILLLNYIRDSEIKEAILNDLAMTVYDYDQALLIDKCAGELGRQAKIHIKIDTGMSRIGFLPGTVAFERILRILSFENIVCEGIYSHFATADIPDDQGNTRKQYNIFDSFVNSLEAASNMKLKRHISNSGAILDYPEYDLDYVRPGIIMYGYLPDPSVPHKLDLKPLMTLKALISNLKVLPEGSGISYGHSFVTRRITKVATIPLGYADGISRLLSNKLNVTVNGEKARSIGMICMDQFMVDVTDIDDVSIGDEVVIFGHGRNDTDLTDMAKIMGTIHYEVMCMISRRIPRVYIKDGSICQIINYL
ncbi:MAG: alanine racemase [Ezakiella sp.]|nr:alanine racemase [Ezakiella sp.]MDD7472234.1 alanine racemase [Bacillota bacterium]MDY3923227.1 alanine racemase [Ezakiella sp.]